MRLLLPYGDLSDKGAVNGYVWLRLAERKQEPILKMHTGARGLSNLVNQRPVYLKEEPC
jgi:hypothetical protein